MEAVVEALAGMAATGVVGYALGWLKRQRKRARAEDAALVAILRNLILDAYGEYVVRGRRCSVERKRELDEMLDAYFVLGGNGTIEKLEGELRGIRPWIVLDEG